ncbi:protein phosphatase [Corynebacterium sp. sy017]|uniref:PP2C family protein-serine/threonine phosphatase n=1 Tax=unclassified Corynebacterium TaxID=2624378 RepID=UPI0011861D6A|nr:MULTISPECIES: protein phosphatase 2C domain-containing protein [unclassified Corynebacterium]MBP3088306.1 protein phosphatase [Corynebacterium sp. sy017]TSD91630.1 protein phosphatase [Corynebacterium sp. SY003]
MLKLNFAIASDRGLVRGNNEDSAYAGPYLLALADGMGGHAAGEIASQLMITHLMRLDSDPGENDMLALLGTVADEANQSIAATIEKQPETDGMGTTLTTFLFNGREFGLCHAGDSRGYRLRGSRLTQLTVDDTYVQSLVAKGELNPEDVSTHPNRSLIFKAYTGMPVEPTLSIVDARSGDRILLCSDGLSDPVTATTIEQTLCTGTPQEAAEKLIELALRSGGPDNVTVVVADVVDEKTTIDLPTEGVVAGALDAETAPQLRPDTAAGRAAIALSQPQADSSASPAHEEHHPPTPATNQSTADATPSVSTPRDTTPAQPMVIPPTQPTEQAHQAAEATGKSDKPAKAKKKSAKAWWITLIAFTLVLIIAGAAAWFYRSLNNTYYITTRGDSQEIVIERGSDITLFGRNLHSTYQKTCLDENDNLTLTEADSNKNCRSFRLDDLRETARTQVASLPAGNYDDVQQQLQRLVEQLLPICVVRAHQPAQTSTPGAVPPSASTAPTSATTAIPDVDKHKTTTPTPVGSLSSPGKNCREAK